MLKFHLKAKENRLEMVSKEISFPFSSFSYADKNVLWNLNSIECKNTRGNFRLIFRRKLDFSNIQTNNDTKKIENITYTNKYWCGLGSPADQHMLLSKHLLLFHDEKNPKISVVKKKLPFMLLSNTMEKKVQFFIVYEKDSDKRMRGEEISVTLNLFEERV